MSDILNSLMTEDLSNVQTTFPLLNAGLCKVRVAEISTAPNKTNTGNNLKIKFVTVDAQPATRAGVPCEIAPGYPIMFTHSLVQTEKFDPRERLAQIMDCFLGKRGSFMPVEQFLGLEGVVKLKHDGKADDEYGIQAVIKQFVKMG